MVAHTPPPDAPATAPRGRGHAIKSKIRAPEDAPDNLSQIQNTNHGPGILFTGDEAEVRPRHELAEPTFESFHVSEGLGPGRMIGSIVQICLDQLRCVGPPDRRYGDSGHSRCYRT